MMKVNNNFSSDIVGKEFNTSQKKVALNSESELPKDSFTPSPEKDKEQGLFSKIKDFALNSFIKSIDLYMFTTVKELSEKKREEILSSVQPGDVILETDCATPGWGIMESLAGGGDYTHAAIYEGDGKFLEATTIGPTGKGVIRSDLATYLKGRIKVEIIRPDYKTPEDVKSALDYAASQLGKPYDTAFDPSDDKFYCSELVAKSLASMPNKIYTPTTNIFGQKVVLPTAFQELKDAKIVYTDKNTVAKTLLATTPAAIGGVAAAVAGGAFLGPVGATVGFIAGTVVTGLIGGGIQSYFARAK